MIKALARLLLRAEAVGSSQIEGLVVGARLVEAGVLTQITDGRRNRAFEAPELVDAFTLLEGRFASPAADIRIEPPSRPVPSRPRTTR